ncbi:MAG: class I SAM-dependent RNA methyltransferase [Firmicutes bacterium]|nr:class I SAM-dependent RNA methyltransferase [Candidatus Colimorpha enterica]
MKNEIFVATCLFGLESLVGEELDALGCKRLETIDGRIWFEAPVTAIPKLNINLRYAERVLLEVGSVYADSFEKLFDGCYGLPWENYIGENDAFPVKGHSIKSKLISLPDCQKIIKKASARRLGDVYGRDVLPENGVKKQIEFFIFKDKASLMIDTTGEPLHKRGYRTEATAAPLRETLAAAMAKIARPREDVLFWDPMCGSGTIAIEAALLMTNTAPGLNRTFAAEEYGWFPKEEWESARDEAVGAIRETEFKARATDISPEAVATAKANIKRAGMSAYIECYVKDALTIETEGRRGTVVCNPPYGERLVTLKEAEQLYRAMGRHFATLDRWQIYVLTSDEYFEKVYGRRADKVRKLYNGMIKCGYYQFFKK